MTEPERWIVIPNWTRYQARYRDGRPMSWIKLHTVLLRDDEYQNLPDSTALLFLHLLLMFATTQARVKDSTKWLTRQLGRRTLRAQLDALNHAGLIEFSVTKPSRKRYGFVTDPSSRGEPLKGFSKRRTVAAALGGRRAGKPGPDPDYPPL
jgi:hypothetical protein